MEVDGQLHALAPLRPAETTPGFQWKRDWVGSKASVDAEAKRKKSQLLPGIRPDCPACRLATIPTELPRLPFLPQFVPVRVET
jgi:hypothetical protein